MPVPALARVQAADERAALRRTVIRCKGWKGGMILVIKIHTRVLLRDV